MIKIVGDINFTDGFFDTGFGVGSAIVSGKDPFAKLERKVEDYWIGNCECVIGKTSNKEGIYKKQFIISPNEVNSFEHLDFYAVANNHCMQHGEIAYKEMLSFFDEQNISHAGSIDKKTHKFIHQGRNVGILVFSQRDEKYSKQPLYWYQPEYIEIKEEIKDLKKEVDFLILYIHWGNEFINYPYVDQKQFARWLIDIGVDLVVGMHSHVLQGYEIYKDKYIFYSLGNFVFNMPSESTRYSCIVNVNLEEDDPQITYDYVYIEDDNFPIIIDSSKMPKNYTFEKLNLKLNINQENEIYYQKAYKGYKEMRKSNIKTFIKDIPKFKTKDIKEIIKDFIKRRF